MELSGLSNSQDFQFSNKFFDIFGSRQGPVYSDQVRYVFKQILFLNFFVILTLDGLNFIFLMYLWYHELGRF